MTARLQDSLTARLKTARLQDRKTARPPDRKTADHILLICVKFPNHDFNHQIPITSWIYLLNQIYFFNTPIDFSMAFLIFMGQIRASLVFRG
jgi:hypothetical protein